MRAAYQRGTALKVTLPVMNYITESAIRPDFYYQQAQCLEPQTDNYCRTGPFGTYCTDSTALFRINVDKQQTTWMEASQESPELQQAHARKSS